MGLNDSTQKAVIIHEENHFSLALPLGKTQSRLKEITASIELTGIRHLAQGDFSMVDLCLRCGPRIVRTFGYRKVSLTNSVHA